MIMLMKIMKQLNILQKVHMEQYQKFFQKKTQSYYASKKFTRNFDEAVIEISILKECNNCHNIVKYIESYFTTDDDIGYIDNCVYIIEELMDDNLENFP